MHTKIHHLAGHFTNEKNSPRDKKKRNAAIVCSSHLMTVNDVKGIAKFQETGFLSRNTFS